MFNEDPIYGRAKTFLNHLAFIKILCNVQRRPQFQTQSQPVLQLVV